MTNRPTDYINRAALAVNVATKWGSSYPTYNVNFTTQTNFLTKAQALQAKSTQNATHDAVKKDNTNALKEVRKQIRANTTRLKNYIKDEYEENADAMYSAYGLEKIKNNFIFPTDGDRLSQRLSMLLVKLQEPNNPIANRKQGLTYWQNLITEHDTLWAASKNMKMDKSNLVIECRDLHKEIGDILSRLYRQIALDYPRDQVALIRRNFGYLNETYK